MGTKPAFASRAVTVAVLVALIGLLTWRLLPVALAQGAEPQAYKEPDLWPLVAYAGILFLFFGVLLSVATMALMRYGGRRAHG